MTQPIKIRPFKQYYKDGTLRINFHVGQREALCIGEFADRPMKMYTLVLAGSQSGKTCIDPIWLRDRIEERGAGDYMAMTSTYDLFKLKFLPEMRQYFEHDLGIARYWSGDKIFELAENLEPGNFKAKRVDDPMWGRIILRSGSAEGGVESGSIKAAVVDEADHPEFSRTAWEGLQRRRNLFSGPVLFNTTIYQAAGWLKHIFYDPCKKGKRDDVRIIQFSSTMNPMFPKSEYEAAKKTMPPWKFRMFYDGQYDKPAGLVYDSFDGDICKISRFDIPKTWPLVVGHDFGGANPAALFYAQDPATGWFYLWHVYLPGSGRSAYEHVQEFKKITEGRIVLRRSGGNRTSEDEIRQAYTAHGWPITAPRVSNVAAQIDRVYGLHKLNKIYAFDDLDEYLNEKATFSYKLDKQYQPIDGQYDNEASYHLMAAERYIMSNFAPETALELRSTKRLVGSYY